MGNRKEITDTLSAAIEKKINPYNDPRIYWAKEVTFDYSTNHAVRVDYMKFVPVNNSVSGIEKGDFYQLWQSTTSIGYNPVIPHGRG